MATSNPEGVGSTPPFATSSITMSTGPCLERAVEAAPRYRLASGAEFWACDYSNPPRRCQLSRAEGAAGQIRCGWTP